MPALASTSEIRSKPAKKETIKFECPHCEGRVRVPKAFAGRKGKCPKCKGVLRVPGRKVGSGSGSSKPRPKPKAKLNKGGLSKRKAMDLLEDSQTGAIDSDPTSEEKSCKYCGETILKRASKCRHCGEWLDAKVRRAKRGQAGKGHQPGILIVMKIWGVILAALNGLGLLAGIALIFIGGGQAFLPAMIRIVISGLLVRIGIGLYNLERAAVIGTTFFGGLGALAGVVLLASPAPGVGLVVLVIVAGLYGPPTVIGFSQWKHLK